MLKIIIYFLLGFIFFLSAQEITLEGKVKDINTHQGLSDVNIYLKDQPVGTTTDKEGKFVLEIPKAEMDMVVIFNHIAYDTLQLSLKEAYEKEVIYLKPNLLQTNRILIEANKEKYEVAKDLPQSLTVVNSVDFAGKGYIDAGDLLRIDQSIQVEEDLSGKKTISMRGGNPEDVIIAYNGIKMNNNYDNVFDLSLIDLEDVEQIEIIKGSNTALFGSDAFSGVVNIVPKTKPDYTARFIQKFGTYDNGDWSLQLNQSFFDKLHLSYSQRRSGSRRLYADAENFIRNKTIHHSASIVYELSKNGDSVNKISIMYMNSKLDYDNNKLFESSGDLNQIGSVSYNGSIGPVDLLNLSVAYQNLDNNQFITTNWGSFDRQLNNKNYYINLEKTFKYENFSLLTAYQYEDGKLDFDEQRSLKNLPAGGLESGLLTLRKYGGVGIFKTETPTGSKFLDKASIDLSLRYDKVINQQRDIGIFNHPVVPGVYKENKWEETTLKFSTSLSGSGKDISYNVFLSTGKNTKFPTMFYQLSTPAHFDPDQPEIISSLNPEHNKSTEIGINVIKETPQINKIDGWQVRLNYFTNYYENKFRSYYIPNATLAFYDNVPNADIAGIESNGKVFLFDNKLTLEFGASHFFISEKSAFPFKSDVKYIANLFLNYKGYSAKVNWFSESDQVGWFRTNSGTFNQAQLPGFANIDVHLAKKFDLDFIKFNLTLSARNILNDNTILEGLAIHDRRFYIGFGVIY